MRRLKQTSLNRSMQRALVVYDKFEVIRFCRRKEFAFMQVMQVIKECVIFSCKQRERRL